MKKFYKENRVFVFLMSISLVCILIICGMGLWYVVGSNTKDTYGNRLDGIKDVEIKAKDVTEMEEAISKMDYVKDVRINIHGKIVNFNVDFNEKTTVDNAKSVGVKCLDFFKDDYKNFYDLQFLFTKKESKDSGDVFPILGYVKAEKNTITWSNNAK